MYDVAIIGAGPAGTAAAYDLLEKGLTVLLMDRSEFPRKKACAGGLTPKALHLYPYDISGVIQRTCHTVNIISPSGRSFQIKSKRPLCYMTDRKELDLFSFNKVCKKGAIFQHVKKVKAIDESVVNHLSVHTDSGVFKARYLIGADGANSRVRRLLVPQFRAADFCAGIEADIRIREPGLYPMEFDFSRLSKGYFWAFPKGGHVNIGIYSTDRRYKFRTDRLREYAVHRFGTDRLTAVKGYPIGVARAAYKPKSGRVLLVGDAAGMSERIFGEGIYFAVKTGQLAAQAIIGTQESGLPGGYLYSRLLKPVLWDLKLHHLASKCIYAAPSMSLSAAGISMLQAPFVKGYADGKPLIRIFSTLFSSH